MGTVYKRADSKFWWISFTEATGKRKSISSESDNREVAERLLAIAERAEKAKRDAGLTEGPLTVARYAEKWLIERARRNPWDTGADANRLAHVLPRIGRMHLKDVRHRHMRELVQWLQTDARVRPQGRRKMKADERPKLAPRTVIQIYATLRVMFSDAVVEELIPSSPCMLKRRRGELPLNVDKDQGWRDNAVFTRGEVEQLISDGRVPEWRRVLYALMFLAGLRVNEITPRKWQDYDAATEPLGQLRVTSSFHMKRRAEKTTKTGRVRAVPVHPTLAAILREWRMHGWAEYVGRHPQPGDLLIPAPRGRKVAPHILNAQSTLVLFHEDLRKLGMRKRRQHDARRTFISLGIADGARKDILRWVSHGPEGDVVDLYTTLPWKTLCDEVLHLKIDRPAGKVVSLTGATAPLR